MANDKTDPLRAAIMSMSPNMPVTLKERLLVPSAWQAPSEHDFNNNWVRIVELLDLISATYGQDASHRYIMDRLKSGVYSAVSRTARSGEASDFTRSFQPISHQFWETWDDYGDDHFWTVGDATFEIATDRAGYDRTVFRYQDVRIDPASLDGRPHEIHTLTEVDTEPTGNPQLAPLSEELLLQWAQLFAKAYPSGTEGAAAKSVAGMFPDKSVTRSRLRRVLPSRSRGRPKQNK